MTEIQEFNFGITVEMDGMFANVKVDGKTVTAFMGETAWMDAEREAFDLVMAKQYG